jgi:hypothetical protein
MQDEYPKQVCILENEYLAFAFFDSCRDEVMKDQLPFCW